MHRSAARSGLHQRAGDVAVDRGRGARAQPAHLGAVDGPDRAGRPPGGGAGRRHAARPGAGVAPRPLPVPRRRADAADRGVRGRHAGLHPVPRSARLSPCLGSTLKEEPNDATNEGAAVISRSSQQGVAQ